MNARKVLKRKAGLSLILILGFVAVNGMLYADDILPDRTGRINNNLIIKTLPSGESDKPAVYRLKDWIVEQEADPVRHALEVYKKKSEPRYMKRVWVTGKKDGKKRLIVEYLSGGTDDRMVFSTDEDFMYYLGIAPGGQNMVYGVSLSSGKKFSLGAAENFNMVHCPGNKDYVVVQQGRGLAVYTIYTVTGERMKTLTNIQDPVDIEKSLCR